MRTRIPYYEKGKKKLAYGVEYAIVQKETEVLHMDTISCAGPSCKNEAPFPTGDGSSIRRNNGTAPVFFCCESCARAWDRHYRHECIVASCHNLVLDGHGSACTVPGHAAKAVKLIDSCGAGISHCEFEEISL